MHAGEYLDESRQWTLQFLNALTPKYPTARGSGLWVVFPDAGEVRVLSLNILSILLAFLL